MKRIIIQIFLWVTLSTCLFSQNKVLIPYRKGDLWGYSNKEKEIIIPCQYSFTQMFRNGFAKVQLRNKWGLIKNTGELVIPIKFDKLWNIVGNIFIGEIKNDIYLLNTIGLEKQLNEEIDKQVSVSYLKQGTIGIRSNNVTKLIDTTGKTLIIPINYFISNLDNEYILVKDDVAPNYYIKKSGHKITLPDGIQGNDNFTEGLAIVSKREKYENIFGFIDTAGTLVSPCIYEYAVPFRHGYAIVKKQNKWGLINKKGIITLPIIYDWCQFETNGMFFITTLNKKQGAIDTMMRVVVPPKYENVYKYFYENGNAIVGMNKKFGMIDSLGNEILPFIYDRIFGSANMLNITLDKKSGIADSKGNILVPTEYDLVCGFFSKFNRNILCKDTKWGYNDNYGKLVIPCIYDECKSFYHSSAWVRLKGQYCLIDTSGNNISHHKYDHIWEYELDETGSKYRTVTRPEFEGLTMTEKYKKKYFQRKYKHPTCTDEKYLFRFDLVKKVLVFNGYVNRQGIEYFEDH